MMITKRYYTVIAYKDYSRKIEILYWHRLLINFTRFKKSASGYGTAHEDPMIADAVKIDGELLFGLGELYEGVMNRLDTISFAITTRYQKRMTLLQF